MEPLLQAVTRAASHPLLRLAALAVACQFTGGVGLLAQDPRVPPAERVQSQTEFVTVTLAPHVNEPIDWVLEPPRGMVRLDGISFLILSGERAAVKSATGRMPTWPTEFAFRLTTLGVRRVHLLLSGSQVAEEPDIVGTVRIVYEDHTTKPVDLIPGVTIQEGWRTERDLVRSIPPSPGPGVSWHTVYREPQTRGTESAFGLFDVLTIETDPARPIARIELRGQSKVAGFQLAAITLEKNATIEPGRGTTRTVVPFTIGGLGGDARQAGGGCKNPTIVKKASPKYTPEATRAKIEGDVELDAIILRDGTVGAMKVTKSLDKKFGLDDQALLTAKKWVFQPATCQGVQVDMVVGLIVEFRLQNGGGAATR